MRALKMLAAASGLAIAISALAVADVAAEEVTLRVWDTFSDQSEGMNAFIAAFEKDHPDIKIVRDVQSIDEMRSVVQTALNSGTGPDVLYYDTGPGFGGVLAKNGLLLPLDDLYASGKLGAVYPWARARTTFDGVTYGVGNELEFVGVYYNRDMFKKLGLEVPTTYEDYLNVAQALKDSGVVPQAFGDADGWPAFHNFSAYANNLVPKSDLEAMTAGKRSWNAPGIVAAIKSAFVDMNQKGYLPPSVNAIAYDDANNLFSAQMAGMDLTGSWMIETFKKNDFSTGIFFLPKPGGGDPLPPAGLGSGYFISAHTKHPTEAKEFLSYLFDPANAHYWVEGMSVIPPFKFDSSKMDIPPLLKFALDAISTVPMGYNIDVLTPDAFNSTMKNGFQAVLAGDRTAEEQAAALQASMSN